MLAKILKTSKKENENFSKRNFISKSQLFSDKIVLATPPQTAAASVVISAGPANGERAHTCPDTCPPARLSTITDSRGSGSLPGPGLVPLSIGDSNRLSPWVRVEVAFLVTGANNIPMPTLQVGDAELPSIIVTYLSSSRPSSGSVTDQNVNRINQVKVDTRHLFSATGGPGLRSNPSIARIEKDVLTGRGSGGVIDVINVAVVIIALRARGASIAMSIAVSHLKLFVDGIISLQSDEWSLTDPFFTPRTYYTQSGLYF